MKNQFARRILSLLLAVTMVAGMLPMGALASTVTEPEQPTTGVVEPSASESAPSGTDAAPADSEPAPSGTETAPADSEPAPSGTETAPADSEPAPSETETVPEKSTTEPQEDVHAPLSLTRGADDAEYPSYLSVWDLYWDDAQSGFREGMDGEYPYERTDYNLTAGQPMPVIFYENTWDGSEYVKTAVIPQSGSSHLVIEKCADLNMGIADSAQNSECYVRLSSADTIGDETVTVTYGDLSLEVTIGKIYSGFFSSSSASWETYLADGYQMNPELESNVLYWHYFGTWDLKDVTVSCKDNAFTPFADLEDYIQGSEEDVANVLNNPVTIEQAGNAVYKLTINPNLVNWGKRDGRLVFDIQLQYQFASGGDDTYTNWANLPVYSWEHALEMATFCVSDKDNINTSRDYYFYEDGEVWCYYQTNESVTDPDMELSQKKNALVPIYSKEFKCVSSEDPVALPGVSYDYKSNTLTLSDASLGGLQLRYSHSYREDGEEYTQKWLPNGNLTLKLVGSSTLSDLTVSDNACVTLAGEGSLTMNGDIYVYPNSTLDMSQNSLLLGAGAVDYDYGGTITGEFGYAEGYTELRVAHLDWDKGYYLNTPEEKFTNCKDISFAAEGDFAVVFYLYTSVDGKLVGEPVIPESVDEYWTITKMTADSIKSGAKDSGYYVTIRSRNTIDGTQAVLKVKGKEYTLGIASLRFGFFTAPEATVANLIPGQQYTLPESGERTIYLVPHKSEYGPDIYIKNVTLELNWEGLEESKLYSVEPLKNDIYKVTFLDGCLKYSDLALIATIDCAYSEDGEIYSEYCYLPLINPKEGVSASVDAKYVAASFEVETGGGIYYWYDFYTDGTRQVYVWEASQWEETNTPIASGFSYNVKNNTLTLNNAKFHSLTMYGSELTEGKLTISLSNKSSINYLTIFDGARVTIQGNGSLTVGTELLVIGESTVNLNKSTKLYLSDPDVLEVAEDSTFTGTIRYTEGSSYIAYRSLTQDEDGTASFGGDKTYYNIERDNGIMGMQERSLVFYKAKYSGGKWSYTPVIPTVSGASAARLSIEKYSGVMASSLTSKEKAAAVVMTSTDLGGGSVALTIDGGQYDWTLYDLHAAYYSSTTPSPDTYLGGESQHYFETTKDGDNTFYFIVREKETGIQVQGDVTWHFDTWGQEYPSFIPGINETSDLVDITEVTTYNGTRVWKITVSDAFVDYVSHDGNWKNFQLTPHVTWEYTDNPGECEVCDYWSMFINPPQKLMEPVLVLDPGDGKTAYMLFEDGKIYCQKGDFKNEEATLEGLSWNDGVLNLDGANLPAMELFSETSYHLNIHVKSDSTISALRINGSNSLNISHEGSATLTIQNELKVLDNSSLNFPDMALILGEACASEIWGNVNGAFSYAEGYSTIALYVLWDDALPDGSFVPTFHGPFSLERYTCMGMNTTTLVFLKQTMGADGKWTWQPVKPVSTDRLTIEDYTTDYEGTYYYRPGYGGDYLEEAPAWADDANDYIVNVTPNFLGNERVTVSLDDEDFQWYVAPLAFGFFSQPEATVDNYLKGDAQHFLDVDPKGSNTFYFITLNALCNYTLDGDVTWYTNTWGQDYNCFNALYAVTKAGDDSNGNHVWKISISNSYVNLAKRYGVWQNFGIGMNAEWYYLNGEHGGVGGWEMWVNPPENQTMPTAFFYIDGYDYYYYKDVSNKILKAGRDEAGNPDISWISTKELPKGVAYDLKSNTMTLTNAQLETLLFVYNDEYGWGSNGGYMMPKSTLTLKLVGNNTVAETDGSALRARGGCNLVITGTGTLNLKTTNTFEEVDDPYKTVWLESGSTLTIGDKAKVNLSNVTTLSQEDMLSSECWLYGIGGDGTGSLTLRNSATLNLLPPEDWAYDQGYTNIDSYPEEGYGLKALTIQDSATLNTGATTLYNFTVNQRGGTWNITTGPASQAAPNHFGLYLENGTLNLSKGTINILPGDDAQTSGMFCGLELKGSVLNMTGGKINIRSIFPAGGYGIVSSWNDEGGPDGSVSITGGTIDITTVPVADEKTFYAFNVGTLTMKGGTINASGELDAETLTMEDGTINLTSTRADGFWVINGSVSGGAINLTNAGLAVSNWREDLETSAQFKISGGKITITGTDAVGKEYEYAGLTNYGYLSMTDGELIVNMPGNVAVKNFGTFHQMGGEVSLTGGDEDTEFGGGDAALRSSGAVLLNSGTMDITGPVGVYQTNEENESWTGEEERYFQVGGGAGDHQLTIHATDIGICADGVVELTGGSQVDIRVTGDEGCGIRANGTEQSKVLIHMATRLNVTATGDDSIALYAFDAPIIVALDMWEETPLCPIVNLRAPFAVMDYRTGESSNYFIDDIVLWSGTGANLTQWGGEGEVLYLTDETGKPATVVRMSEASEARATYAQFDDIGGKPYRIHEEDGKQIVESYDEESGSYQPATLPKGVSYNLNTNTLTLAKNTTLSSLTVCYNAEVMNQQVCKLPSKDFTIKLNSKATIGRLQLGNNQGSDTLNTTLTGGTLTLTGGYDDINGSIAYSSLTVAKGAGLTISGSLAVRAPGGMPTVLTIAKGATLTNNGSLYMNHLELCENASINVQGKFSQGKNGETIVYSKFKEQITGNLPKSAQTLVFHISDESELAELKTLSAYKSLRVNVQSMTLTQNFTIPANMVMNPMDKSPLTIKDGGTLIVKGGLGFFAGQDKISPIINNGTIRLDKGGILSVHGNFQGNAPINNGGKITPQASKVTITPEATTFDLFKMTEEEKTAKLTVNITPNKDGLGLEPLHRVTWKSSDEKIIKEIRDNQDGTYTAVFTGRVGKVTLTATTIDGAKKTAKVTLNVTYLGTGSLKATQEDSTSRSFLQVGETATMQVLAQDTVLNGLNGVVTFKSSSSKVATVDENGVITGIKTGTAKITATMAIPGDKRSVTITVKVVSPQILRLNLYKNCGEETKELSERFCDESNNVTFDLRDLKKDSSLRTFKVYAGGVTWSTEMGELAEQTDTYISAGKLKWASSDTGVATVKTHKDGYAIVSIKSGAHGVFTLTATATDTNKTVASVTYIVKDYTPRLTNPSVTLNPKQQGGVKLNLVESYGNTIQANGVTIVPDKTKDNGKLTITSIPVGEGKYEYYVSVAMDEAGKPIALSNQTIKAKLHFKTEKGNDFAVPVTVTVKSATPKITVSQGTASAKFDLAYREENELSFTSSSGEVYRVELASGSSPDFQFDAHYAYAAEDGESGWDSAYEEGKDYTDCFFCVKLSENLGKSINTNLKFLVYVKGYHDPVAVTYKLKTTTSKIKLTVNPTSSVINTALSDQYKVSFRIFDGYGENILNDDTKYTFRVLSGKDELSEEQYGVKEGKLAVTFDKPFSGTLTVKVDHPSWAREQQVTHKVTKTDKVPTIALDSALTLYRTFRDVTDSAGARFNQSNLTLAKMDNFKCSNSTAQQSIHLEYNESTGKIVASFKEDVTPVKAGTYTFTATAYYLDDGEPVKLSKQVSVSVKVVQEPTFKMASSTIKLNKYLAADKGGTEQGWVATKGSLNSTMTIGDAGYLEIKGLVSKDGSIRIGKTGNESPETFDDEKNGIRLGMNVENYGFQVTASLLKSTAKKTTYTLYPVVERIVEGDTVKYYTMSTPIKFTVQPHSSKASVSLSTSGKLDTLLPDSAITYTATVKNALHDTSEKENDDWKISNIQLLDEKGNSTDLFQIEHGVTSKKGVLYDTITLKLNPAQGYVANKTYKVKLRYTICGTTVTSGTLSVKVNQSTAKVSASSVSYYHAEGIVSKTIRLKLTSPAKASIAEVKLNKKTSRELVKALAAIEAENFAENTLTVNFADPAALKAGKTYSLYLDVYPATLATTRKPTTVKVSVKVAK